ncbi:MAG: tetratricopeptide repeat protein [Spirochaetales bacterium]|nr:tetratricopeptide repeat protein [Spirochaetales bacterium]
MVIISAVLIPMLIFVLRFALKPRKVAAILAFLKTGKINQAVRAAKQVIAKDPRNADAHYLLGRAYLEAEKPELALMEYKTVNHLGMFSGIIRENDFRRQIAKLYIQNEQYEEALKEFLMLIKFEPNVAEHYFHVGDLFEERGRTDRAAIYYQKSVELDREFAEAYFRLGRILYRDKKPIEARMALEKAVRNDSENSQAFFYLGKLMRESHDYVGALIHYEKAEKDPELKTKVLVERGTCYMSTGNYDSAIAEFERAIRLTPDDTKAEILYARYFLGVCFEKSRRFEQAVDQWEKVYARRPQFRDVAEKLSQYQELRTDDRIKDYLTATQVHFIEICQSIIQAMKLEVRDITEVPNGVQILAVEAEQKWRGARKMPKLIRLFRVPELIDDSSVRNLHETMKKMKITKGIIITSSSFSRRAIDFAETRPIDLLNKDNLRELLALAEVE